MTPYNHINYIRFQSIDSTNTWAKQQASLLDPDQITCITSQEQTAGRGRFQKKWISPKGVNLYVTYFFYIPTNFTSLPNLGQILSISCSKLLEELGFVPKIKWPNDVHIDGKKIAGILCETVSVQDKLAIALGIGINVNMNSETIKEIDQPATSLQELSGHEWSLDEVLHKLSKYVLADLNALQEKGFSPFRFYYENHLAYKGQLVTIQDGNRTIQGFVHSISPQGNLIMLCSGEQIEIHAGSMIAS